MFQEVRFTHRSKRLVTKAGDSNNQVDVHFLLVSFVPFSCEVSVPNLSLLALKLREEIGVTDRRQPLPLYLHVAKLLRNENLNSPSGNFYQLGMVLRTLGV